MEGKLDGSKSLSDREIKEFIAMDLMTWKAIMKVKVKIHILQILKNLNINMILPMAGLMNLGPLGKYVSQTRKNSLGQEQKS